MMPRGSTRESDGWLLKCHIYSTPDARFDFFVVSLSTKCKQKMEKLLHYVWMHKLLPDKTLTTTDGQEVEILDPGTHNTNRGPDFSNARIRMDGMTWVGNVELHTAATDWFRHGHHTDPVYNTTILHVVERADAGPITMQNGQHVPQVVVEIPQAVRDNYEELLVTTDYPRCHRFVAEIPALKVHAWLDALLAERMEARARRILDILKECRGDWEQTTFITLARNFGFGLNGDIFEMWARRIPLQAAGKHRDNLLQVESLFLGTAGLTGREEDEDKRRRLDSEYRFLCHKFSLPGAMDASLWHYLRTRPQNFPDVRIRQLARLFHEGGCTMSRLLEHGSAEEVDKRLASLGISKGSRSLIIINTVASLLYAYYIHHGTYEHRERAVELLENLPGERNHILAQWKACGLDVATAHDSQALIQLKKEYCDHARCLDCRFGFEYISHTMKQHG